MTRKKPQPTQDERPPGEASPGSSLVFAEHTYAGSLEHPDHNEDATLVLSDSRIAAVFDGLGGGERGEEASALAREMFEQLLRNLPPDLTEEEAVPILDRVFREADKAVTVYAWKMQAMGMGTTATAVLLVEGDAPNVLRAVVGSVADSRAHILHDGRLETITVDNVSGSTPEDAIEKKRPVQTALAAAERPDDLFDVYDQILPSRFVTQPLGDGAVDPRIVIVSVQPGDRILLSTDGVHDNLTNDEMAAILADSSADEAAESLVAAARERSRSNHFRAKPDDMSVVVIDVPR